MIMIAITKIVIMMGVTVPNFKVIVHILTILIINLMLLIRMNVLQAV